MTQPDPLVLRRATALDDAGIRQLVAREMGWGDGGHAARMWDWKHEGNPFGPSPRWVAAQGDRIVAVRIFLRWQFVTPAGGAQAAVRAVDTVTDREFRGQGLFRRLTLQALDDMAREGVDFVFNTPNDLSRPGYLSMGWQPRGRLPVAAWGNGAAGWAAMARNRRPADLGSLPSSAGQPAGDGLDDDVIGLLDRPSAQLTTRRSAGYLRWRYAGLPDLHYRVVRLGRDPREGVGVVRVRRRGSAVEAAVLDSFAPSRRQGIRLTLEVARSTGATHVLALPQASGAVGVPVPKVGPQLTVREIAAAPPEAGGLSLALGDVELF
ncbi:GNAT family N-acetyltransferase [Blastococcus saxobsidens]|uniref:Putative acyl-CoA N-acyltransferase n=1 Tax=Blastococcus saxobsidens (strain DD2) TaxID=1146883 RepID=H6RM76_BLASD|nr:GNAT family N-acetyltransferase [Blastococcus saxobsidens]CCG01318.1 Putative acyl-CoA N-acyltransferase [Blastococcus saxobsidens DD2]